MGIGKLTTRELYNRTDWPGSESFNPPHLQGYVNKVAEELAALKREAAKPCRCDGGGTECGACIAEKSLRTYGSAAPIVRSGRFSASKPNEGNKPKDQFGPWRAHKHLVIGYRGQVGSAIYHALQRQFTVYGIDYDWANFGGKADVMHICIPYSKAFARTVRLYAKHHLTPGGLIIIHSTVPVGTSTKLGAVHSPVRGVHPNLLEGVLTFEKFFGGPRAAEAARYFVALQIDVVITPKAENTEALKLWDTTYYGWNIIFEKAVHAYCKRHKLDFDLVYTMANKSYNDGYTKLGKANVSRPVLGHMPGPIGGHCVLPNAKLLGGKVAEILYELGAVNPLREE